MSDHPVTSPDRGARLALSGFLWGLVGCIVSMLASLNFLAGLFLYNFFVTHQGGIQPLSISEVLLLLVVAFPAAVVGLILSVRGRHSTSRRRLARAGMIFSFIALIPFVVALVVLTITFSYCSMHSCI
jgi:hypothetical protein